MEMLQNLLSYFLDLYLNLGLATGLLLGALLLLRPVLKRVLTPRQRLLLWLAAWMGAYSPVWYSALSWFHVLPVTFRDLITPRTMDSRTVSLPAYLPSLRSQGSQHLALPGGLSIPVAVEPWMAVLAGAVFLSGIIFLTWRFDRSTKALKAKALQGRLLDWGGPELKKFYGLKPAEDTVRVRLCSGLPTSFVYAGGEKIGGHPCDVIYLQEELSPQRRALVLRHELNHLKSRHTWMKGIFTVALLLHWWNPLVWLGYKYTCLDLELDCDRATLDQLSPENRREYARTLVELGAGKQIWDAPLAFGESDGAVRVKAAVAWKRPNFWLGGVKWALFAVILLFFVGGPIQDVVLPADLDRSISEQFGSAAAFVQQDLALQYQEHNIPQSLSVQSVRRQIDSGSFFRMAYELSDGRWGESNWFCYQDGPWECVGWDWLSEPPDPSQYRPYPPAQ